MSEGLKTVLDDLDFATNRIGEQTRTIALGVLAVAWLFLAGGRESPALAPPPDVSLLLAAGGLAVSSLLTDYFQYLFAYFGSQAVLERAEAAPDDKPAYEYSSFTHRARRFFFWAKQLLCLAGAAVLFLAVVRARILD